MKRRRITTWTWTNWTFGVWYSSKLRSWGIDVGPLEVVWRR